MCIGYQKVIPLENRTSIFKTKVGGFMCGPPWLNFWIRSWMGKRKSYKFQRKKFSCDVDLSWNERNPLVSFRSIRAFVINFSFCAWSVNVKPHYHCLLLVCVPPDHSSIYQMGGLNKPWPSGHQDVIFVTPLTWLKEQCKGKHAYKQMSCKMFLIGTMQNSKEVVGVTRAKGVTTDHRGLYACFPLLILPFLGAIFGCTVGSIETKIAGKNFKNYFSLI